MPFDANVGRGLDRAFPDASRMLAELEAIGNPGGYARGRLSAIRLARLEPGDRNAAEALARRWGMA